MSFEPIRTSELFERKLAALAAKALIIMKAIVVMVDAID